MLLLLLFACDKPTCLDGDSDCEMPSPCPEVEFTCDAGSVAARVLGPGDPFPGGMDTLAAPGDILLGNDRVQVIIDALDHPHYIAPTGGAILDMGITGKDNDSVRHIFGATGLLPEEAFHFTSLEVVDGGSEFQAVQAIGTLDGYPDIAVATRYEVRPCEPGIRVRTEIANGTPDALSMYLTDAFYWGGRELIPFTPRAGSGFNHPEFGLTTISSAFFEVPFMVGALHSAPASSVGVLSCDDEVVSGFQSDNVSAMGEPPRVFPSKDWEVYERFIFLSDGAAVSTAADIAYDLRKQLWGEAYVTVSGTVVAPGGQLGETMRASLEIIDADDVPVTQVLPAADGSWSARVPANRSYTILAEAFGIAAAESSFTAHSSDVDAGELTLPAVGEVSLDVTVDGVEDHALVFILPADDATEAATIGTVYGFFEDCAPMLGLTHGASPACNRVLVNGPTTVALPPGTYDFYTAHGPFSSLGAERGVKVEPVTGQSVSLAVETLHLQPVGSLTGDFHVHGGKSFDANIPDVDRVKAFVAAGIDVIVSTEHDAVNDYAAAIESLGVADRLLLVTGTESTGHLLFKYRTDYGFPQVVGHWMFWPVPYDPEGPYRGAAYDEKAEPGLLFTREVAAGWDKDNGVNQLNHPYGGAQFGRDYSWASAAGFDQSKPLQAEYDGTGQSLFFHTPDGADFSNADYDVQEVMNGTKNENLVQYRSFWYYLLNQGIVRGGMANSDSHSLVENVLGIPRNVVFTSTTREAFDVGTFDADVRAGHVLGTNGPVILANIAEHTPGTEAFVAGDSDVLHLVVRAAPWVPVDEVRIVVNGEVKLTLTDLLVPEDPFGTTDLDRLDTDVPLSELLPASGDAYIVVEAGHALEPQADLDCNDLPDTGDNNGDGKIDWKDVEELTEDPGVDCLDTVGPLAEPVEPERGTPDWWFRAVTPGGYPAAFTNPFLLDRDGDGSFSGVK